MKQYGQIRVCGGYQITIDQAIMADSYPLLRVEDLFSALAGDFSKLDISQTYLQIAIR